MTRWQWKWTYWKATRFEDAADALGWVLIWGILFAACGMFQILVER